MLRLLVPLSAVIMLAGCRGEPAPPDSDTIVLPTLTPGPPPTETSDAVTVAVEPTVVQRRAPTMTPAPTPEPMSPVASKVLPGIPVPYGATLIRFEMARPTSDALAQYSLADADDAALREWFREHMPAMGWGPAEERDGALLFLHQSEMPHRDEDDDQRRTATVVFGLPGAAAFTIIAEEPR